MGCGDSKEQKENTHTPKNAISLNNSKASTSSINKMDELKIGQSHMIVQKFGKITSEYKISKVIGTGAFGEVVKATFKPTNEQRAIKKIKKKNLSVGEQNSLLNEISVLKKLVTILN